MTDSVARTPPVRTGRYCRHVADRDLDLVLVTGAGASCSFGVKGTPLPLMSDWSDYVLQKLLRANYILPQAAGLEQGLPGTEFEKRLGTFLRRISAFEAIGPLIELSTQLPGLQPQLTTQGLLAGWHRAATGLWHTALEAVYESLYELFGDPRVDADAAVSAYGELLRTLGIGPDSRWVYATTNYDTIGERVIDGMGRRADWGEPPNLLGYAEQPLDVARLVEGAGRYVPVLHLHGRIGWFRRSVEEGGRVYGSRAVRYTTGIGVPVVMLPDPAKDYDSDDVIQALWREFRLALSRARRVLVLGHSLNDPALVTALQAVVPQRLAVAVLAGVAEPTAPDPSAAPVVELVHRELLGATIVPLRFGTPLHEVAARSMSRWLRDEPTVPQQRKGENTGDLEASR